MRKCPTWFQHLTRRQNSMRKTLVQKWSQLTIKRRVPLMQSLREEKTYSNSKKLLAQRQVTLWALTEIVSIYKIKRRETTRRMHLVVQSVSAPHPAQVDRPRDGSTQHTSNREIALPASIVPIMSTALLGSHFVGQQCNSHQHECQMQLCFCGTREPHALVHL